MNDPYEPPRLELIQAAGDGSSKAPAPGAQASMILGIVGLALFVLTCSYFAIITLILSIIGVVLAAKAKRIASTNPEQFSDSGMRTAGLVLNVLGLILGGLWTALVVVAIIIAMAFSKF